MDKKLDYSPKNAWDIYSSAEERAEIKCFAEKYLLFLTECKTERKTVEYVQKRLMEAGFSEDFNGDKVFSAFRNKAIFAARKGKNSLANGIRLISAHGDSPRLDLKQKPLIEQAGIAQAKTHYYGGIRKYQWLARPLALHGIMILANGEKLPINIGDNDGDPVFCVADLLPHLAQKQASQKLSEAFEGEKLNLVIGHLPVCSLAEDAPKEKIKANVLELLHNKYGICEEDFISAELEAVPQGKAGFVGIDQALLGGYGQDDRICVFCSLEAFLDAKTDEQNLALMIWDKEEIGSDGATGASSRILEYCIQKLAHIWQPNALLPDILLNTMAISADVTAALDPDYQDVHEKQNAALIGHGPCFSKFTGSRGKYDANDADAEYFGYLRGLFNKWQIPWQAAELGKVDLGGGGTIAKFLAAYGMNIIDLGPALLSMHSPFELSSCVDLYSCKNAYKVFYEG